MLRSYNLIYSIIGVGRYLSQGGTDQTGYYSHEVQNTAIRILTLRGLGALRFNLGVFQGKLQVQLPMHTY